MKVLVKTMLQIQIIIQGLLAYQKQINLVKRNHPVKKHCSFQIIKVNRCLMPNFKNPRIKIIPYSLEIKSILLAI